MIWPTLLLAAAGLAAAPALAGGGPLERFAGGSRVLVVIAPQPSDPRLEEQRCLFAAARAGNVERDLVLVEGSGRGERAEALRSRFGIAPDAFRAILVGKDGRAKIVSSSPLRPERLFAEIDQMPMRRDEMRRRTSRRGDR